MPLARWLREDLRGLCEEFLAPERAAQAGVVRAGGGRVAQGRAPRSPPQQSHRALGADDVPALGRGIPSVKHGAHVAVRTCQSRPVARLPTEPISPRATRRVAVHGASELRPPAGEASYDTAQTFDVASGALT